MAQTGPEIFVSEYEPSAASRARMAKIGLTDTLFPPLANRRTDDDFVSGMRQLLLGLAKALQ